MLDLARRHPEAGVPVDRDELARFFEFHDFDHFPLSNRPDGLVSFGLGGPEAGIGRAQYEPFFTAAREAGLHSVPHAGETTGPATIWSALHDLGAERIGFLPDGRKAEIVAEIERVPLPG